VAPDLEGDPSFAAPIYANLFEGDNGEFALIWSR